MPVFWAFPAGAALSSPNFGLVRSKRSFLREGGDGKSCRTTVTKPYRPLPERGRGGGDTERQPSASLPLMNKAIP